MKEARIEPKDHEKQDDQSAPQPISVLREALCNFLAQPDLRTKKLESFSSKHVQTVSTDPSPRMVILNVSNKSVVEPQPSLSRSTIGAPYTPRPPFFFSFLFLDLYNSLRPTMTENYPDHTLN